MNQVTKKLIEKFSPMWTNKQIWEFDQINEDLKFDVAYVEPKNAVESWKSKLAYQDSDIRDIIVKTFDYLSNGKELWIANKNQGKLTEEHIPYLMALMVDIMIKEVYLNFRIGNYCLIVSIDDEQM